MCRFDSDLLEVLIFHHNIPTALVFQALYDLVGGNLFRVRFRHLFVFNRTEIAGTKLPEAKLLLSGGRINSHWDINQPETDAAFPNWAHTGECFPIVLRLSTLDSPRREPVSFAEIPCNSKEWSDVWC